LPERSIMTGIGPVAVRQPRVRDRAGADGERLRFSPNILPRYARRTKSLEALIPILYLKGISTGDFEEALSALVGADAPGLSASTIARLKEAWSEEHDRWRKRDLSAKRYVYWWVDGIWAPRTMTVSRCDRRLLLIGFRFHRSPTPSAAPRCMSGALFSCFSRGGRIPPQAAASRLTTLNEAWDLLRSSVASRRTL
jgi:hypothetical protein